MKRGLVGNFVGRGGGRTGPCLGELVEASALDDTPGGGKTSLNLQGFWAKIVILTELSVWRGMGKSTFAPPPPLPS